MAKEVEVQAVPQADQEGLERERLKEEKRQLKAQKKEAKRRAREIARQEDELDENEGGGSGLVTFGATLLIVLLWIAVICVVVKLDIGGFGSSVLTPILKDVPVLNRILPSSNLADSSDQGGTGGYSSLEEAVAYIKQLELELERYQTASNAKDADLETQRAEIERLQEFEDRQVEFQRITQEFYDEVIYSDKGPGPEEYRKYYETMDPVMAEYYYKQVINQQEESKEIQDFVMGFEAAHRFLKTYTEMKAKDAAKIFEEMTDNLNLVARILGSMSAKQRGDILGAMDAEIAAKLTKIMDPES